MVLQTNIKLCVKEPDFAENIFPKKWKNGSKMDQKQSFLNLFKNLVFNFYWICSVMKVYIICCVPGQIPYLGKSLSLRYGPKYSQPITLQDYLIKHISKIIQWNSLIFFHIEGSLHKLIVDQKLSRLVWSKMGVASLANGLQIWLYLKYE